MDTLDKLQEWLDTDDYITSFKRNKVVFRKYPDKDLMIIKQKYGSPYSEDKFWLNYCRGLIINYKTNKLVFVPPIKSIEVLTIEELHSQDIHSQDIHSQDIHSQDILNLVDGTMINLFNVNNEWLLSTRSNIGCKNKWSQDMNFKQMFDECSKDLNYESLHKDHTYSFVMRHTKNKMISKVEKNELVLVEVYKGLQKQPLSKQGGYTLVNEWSTKGVFKGFTISQNGIRYKWLSNEQKFLNMINPNTNNPCLNYITLRNSGHLPSYLDVFPEMRFEFDKYRKKIHSLTQLLYQYYVSIHIKKQLEKKDIPFVLKPLVYELHGLYLKHKQGISYQTVKQYIYELEPKRLQFVINGLQ